MPNTPSQSVVYGKHLKRIVFPSGKLEFSNVSSDGVPDDQWIKLYDKNDDEYFSWELKFDYFIPSGSYVASDKRIKLLSVQKYGVNGASEPPYLFSYNNQALPVRDSKQQDHWGYHNSNSKTTLLPSLSMPGIEFEGADRTTDPTRVKACLIEKITYPTGGEVSFEFEPNTIYDPHYTDGLTTFNKETSYPTIISYDFSLDQDQNIKLTTQLTKINTSNPDPAAGTIKLYKKNGSNWTLHSTLQNNLSNSLLYVLEGDYRIALTPDYNSKLKVFIRHKYKDVYNEHRWVGGTRIKKIVTYDGLDHARDMIRVFEYNDFGNGTTSSGVLHRNIKYDYPSSYWSALNGACNSGQLISVQNLQYAFVGSGQRAVSYPNVTERIGLNGEKGYIRYTFSVAPTKSGFAFAPSDHDDYLYGKLTRKAYYSAQDVLKKEELNTYQIVAPQADDIIHGIKFRYKQLESNCYNGGQLVVREAKFSDHSWKYTSQDIRLISEQIKIYNPTASAAYVTTNDYEYAGNNHLYATKITSFDSRGYTYINEYHYPHDYTISNAGSFTSAIQGLIQEYRVGQPIEEVRWIDKGQGNLLLKASLTEYKMFSIGGSSHSLPYKTYQTELSTPSSNANYTLAHNDNNGILSKDGRLVEQSTFDRYTAHRQLVDFHRKHLKATSIHANNDELMVVKFNQASSADVAYLGFETDLINDWTVQSYHSIASDGFTGDKSLYLQPTNQGGIRSTEKILVPEHQVGSFLVSCWVKTGSASNANLVIHTTSGGTSTGVYPQANGNVHSYVTQSIPALEGEWQQVVATINLDDIRANAGLSASTSLGIRVYVENLSTTASLQVDDIVLRPALSSLELIVFDARHRPIGSMGGDHLRTQYEYDNLGRLKLVRDHKNRIIEKLDYNIHQ